MRVSSSEDNDAGDRHNGYRPGSGVEGSTLSMMMMVVVAIDDDEDEEDDG